MVSLISRENVFKDYPAMAKYISDYQQMVYEYEKDSLTKAEDKWFRGKMDNMEVLFDKKYVGESVYQCNEETLAKYISNFIAAIEKLLQFLGNTEICFVLEDKRPWLIQKHTYKPVAKAQNELKQAGVKTRYTGGICVNGKDVKKNLRNIFWLVRCCAAMSDVYFTIKNSYSVFSICKSGGLHIHHYDERETQLISQYAGQLNLKLTKGYCNLPFDYNGIKGRQIIL